MDAHQFVESARTSGAALLVAADGNLEREIASCPGWSVADLITHTAEGCAFLTTLIPGQDRDDASNSSSAAPADQLQDDLGVLLAAIDGVDPAKPCWTWAPAQQNVGFVQRRIAQELAMHRWDVENAIGHSEPIASGLAIDGIDEFLHVQLFRHPPDPDAAPVGGSVHLHPTDGGGAGEWEIVPTPPGSDVPFDVQPGHAKSDVAIRGTASDLLLTLWRRLDGAVEILGHADVGTRFLAATKL